MRISKYGNGVFAGVFVLASGVAVAAPASSLQLTGRVEYVSSSEGVLYVLGHRITSGDAQRVVKGQLVRIYGVKAADGSINSAQIESVSAYSTGADQIYMNGVISAVDARVGVAYVDSIAVPLAEIAGNGATPKVGDAVGVFGTQSAANAPVLVRGVILSGGGAARAEILSGGGAEQAQILSGGGTARAEILSGGGAEQAQILSGGGAARAEILSGGGAERAAILSGGGGSP